MSLVGSLLAGLLGRRKRLPQPARLTSRLGRSTNQPRGESDGSQWGRGVGTHFKGVHSMSFQWRRAALGLPL